MEENIAKKGLKATESLHHKYQELLRLLGVGNMLFDASVDGDPSTVPDKCENTIKLVEELIKSMKTLLKTITHSYDLCCQERAVYSHKMLLCCHVDNISTYLGPWLRNCPRKL